MKFFRISVGFHLNIYLHCHFCLYVGHAGSTAAPMRGTQGSLAFVFSMQDDRSACTPGSRLMLVHLCLQMLLTCLLFVPSSILVQTSHLPRALCILQKALVCCPHFITFCFTLSSTSARHNRPRENSPLS